MSELGVFRHYKKGNLYLALFIAKWCGTDHELKEGDTLALSISAFTERLWLFPSSQANESTILSPCYTGDLTRIPSRESLVVYVGLYDNPHGNRPCARPVSEWNEEVDVYDASIGAVVRGFDLIPFKVRRYTKISE